jgi:thienamycin biosynthesis protein ThnO
MTSIDVASGPPAIAAPSDAVVLECLFGRENYRTYATYDIAANSTTPFARACRAPRPLQSAMLQEATRAATSMRQIPQDDWLHIFALAGRDFAHGPGAVDCAALASRSSGLPRARVLKAYAALAADLSNMGEILDAQVPRGASETFYRSEPDPARPWRSVPRGRNLAVRVPGNFPTININWLVALAARRPVLLCASLLDPFTPRRLAASLYNSGVPDHAISVCYHDAEVWWSDADQVLMSGELPQSFRRQRADVQSYHQGRSKLVVAGGSPGDDVVSRVALNATQGCGRLCTNISAVLTDGDARQLAVRLARQLSAFEILPLDDPRAAVPAFPNQRIAESIAAQIEAAERRGGCDLTAAHSGKPLRAYTSAGLFLRPTVLLVDADDPIFGTEFPFPFVTVAEVPPAEFVTRCRDSLVVAVIGLGASRIEEFVFEPTIDKVFAGDEFDRAYNPAEPHQGWLTDFLFKKKVASDVYEHASQ